MFSQSPCGPGCHFSRNCRSSAPHHWRRSLSGAHPPCRRTKKATESAYLPSPLWDVGLLSAHISYRGGTIVNGVKTSARLITCWNAEYGPTAGRQFITETKPQTHNRRRWIGTARKRKVKYLKSRVQGMRGASLVHYFRGKMTGITAEGEEKEKKPTTSREGGGLAHKRY